MASPFEILEAYVKVGERGLTPVMQQLTTLRNTLRTITAPTYTVRVNTQGSASLSIGRLAANVQTLQNSVGTINSLRISNQLPSALQNIGAQARVTVNDIRPLNNELRLLISLLGQVRTSNIRINTGFGATSGRGSLTTQLQTVRDLRSAIVSLQGFGGLAVLGQFSQVSQFTFAIRSLFDAFREVQRLRDFAASTNNQAAAARAAAQASQLYRAAMFGVAGGAAAAAAAILTVGTAIQAQREALQVQLEALTGGVANAEDISRRLQAFASRRGLSFEALLDDAKQLAALGVPVERIADLTERLGIASQATGADVRQLARALTQIEAAGVLRAQERLQLVNANIPILQQLQANLGVTAKRLQELVEQGQVTAGDVRLAFEQLTDSQSAFARASEKAADTTIGAWSRLKENSKQFLGEVGVNGVVRESVNLLAELARSSTEVVKSLNPQRDSNERVAQVARLQAAEERIRKAQEAQTPFRKATEAEEKRIAEIIKESRTDYEKIQEAMAEINKLAAIQKRSALDGRVLSGIEGGLTESQRSLALRTLQLQLERQDREERERTEREISRIIKEQIDLQRNKDKEREDRLSKGLKISQPDTEAARQSIQDLLDAVDAGLPANRLQQGIDAARNKLIEATLQARKLRKELEPSQALLRGTEAEVNFRIKDEANTKRQTAVLEDLRRIQVDENRKFDQLLIEVRGARQEQRERELDLQEAILEFGF